MLNKILSTRDYVDLSVSAHNISVSAHPDFFPLVTDMQSMSANWNTAYTSISTLEPLLPVTPDDPELKFLNGNREWAPIAIGGGGFAGNLYFTTLSSDISGYKKISYDAGLVETELSGTITNGEILLRSYVYDEGIDTTVIDAGVWVVNYRSKVSKPIGTTKLRMEVFLHHTNGTETTLFSFLTEDLNNEVYEIKRTEYNAPSYTCETTDRLGAHIYVSTNSNTAITVYTIIGDGTGSYFTTPIRMRHNQLRELTSDDHPQYLPINGIRGMTGNLNVSGDISGNSFNINVHNGYTHIKRIMMIDEDGDPVSLYLRGGILTIN